MDNPTPEETRPAVCRCGHARDLHRYGSGKCYECAVDETPCGAVS